MFGNYTILYRLCNLRRRVSLDRFEPMKKLLIIFIIVSLYSQVLAQDVSLGIKAGVNLSERVGQDIDNSGFLVGFHLGPTVSLKASDNIFIIPSLLISQKGNMTHRVIDEVHGSESWYSDSKQQFRFTYLELPVYAKFKIAPGLGVFVGPQFSYLLNARSKSERYFRINDGEEHFQDLEDDILKGYNKFDLAVVVGIDYLFSNGINVSAGYDFGLYELEDVAYYGKSYNRVLKFSLGYFF